MKLTDYSLASHRAAVLEIPVHLYRPKSKDPTPVLSYRCALLGVFRYFLKLRSYNRT
jgi:hypothetical protein